MKRKQGIVFLALVGLAIGLVGCSNSNNAKNSSSSTKSKTSQVESSKKVKEETKKEEHIPYADGDVLIITGSKLQNKASLNYKVIFDNIFDYWKEPLKLTDADKELIQKNLTDNDYPKMLSSRFNRTDYFADFWGKVGTVSGEDKKRIETFFDKLKILDASLQTESDYKAHGFKATYAPLVNVKVGEVLSVTITGRDKLKGVTRDIKVTNLAKNNTIDVAKFVKQENMSVSSGGILSFNDATKNEIYNLLERPYEGISFDASNIDNILISSFATNPNGTTSNHKTEVVDLKKFAENLNEELGPDTSNYFSGDGQVELQVPQAEN